MIRTCRWLVSIILFTVAGFLLTIFLTGMSGQEATGVPTRHANHVPGTFSFSAPIELTGHPPSPAFFQQDIEPEIKIDIWGTIYVTAIQGVPGGTDFWKSTDKGASFVYLGQPDGAQDHCMPPDPQCAGLGGGDDSIEVSNGGYLYVSSLWLGNVTLSTSFDGGAGGVAPGQAWQVNPAATGTPPVPVSDRQWLAAYGPQTLYMTWDQAPANTGIWFTKSTDAGKTFSVPTNLLGPSSISREYSMAVDQYNGNIYFTYSPVNAPNQINMFRSTDGGASFTQLPVYTGPAGTSVENAFVSIAVDKGGNIHLAFTRSIGLTARTNAHVFLMSSTDQGATWLPPVQVDSGANTQSTVMPWITAGSPGVVDITWYGSSSASPDAPPFDWHVFFAQTNNALDPNPTFTQVLAVPGQVHDAAICSQGGNCPGGATGTRMLAEYYTITLDPEGNANIAYPNSIDNCPSATCLTNTWFVKQTGGASAITPPSPPGPATFAPNIAIPGQSGTAEPNAWVDSHNCIYAGAIGGPKLSKSEDAGLTFTTKTVALGSGVHGGDFDVITLPKPDGSRPDQIYTADLGIVTVHIGKSTDGFATFFQPTGAGEVSVSSDRMWLYPDRNVPAMGDQTIYLVDHEFTTEAIRFSALTNDLAWSPFADGLTDPELLLPPTGTLPNTNPGPDFVSKITHNVFSVFGASSVTTNLMEPPFGKESNVWEAVGPAPAAAGLPPGPFVNHPVFKGVIDSPTAPPPPAGTITYGTHVAAIFPSGDADSAGNVYVVWSMNSARPNAVQTNNQPTHTFDIWMAVSHDGGANFYGPFRVSSGIGTAVFPWIAAGDAGRVDIVWYQSSNVAPPLLSDPSSPGTLTGGPNEMPPGSTWNVMFAQSLNATSREPVFTVSQASDHSNHTGSISIGGTTGSSDRSLLDFFEVATGPDGLANIAYADNGGGAGTHITYARQNSGPTVRINPVFTTCLEQVQPPQPIAAVSRKTHAAAGTFDVDLLPPAPAIECRRGTPSGQDFTVVITFAAPVTTSGATVMSTDNMATADPPIVAGNTVTVNLHNVTNANRLTITLLNVNGLGNVSVPMNVLLGDTTASGAVNSSDISQTKGQTGQVVGGSNFREDVTVDGNLNSSDISLVKSKTGTALPPP